MATSRSRAGGRYGILAYTCRTYSTFDLTIHHVDSARTYKGLRRWKKAPGPSEVWEGPGEEGGKRKRRPVGYKCRLSWWSGFLAKFINRLQTLRELLSLWEEALRGIFAKSRINRSGSAGLDELHNGLFLVLQGADDDRQSHDDGAKDEGHTQESQGCQYRLHAGDDGQLV